MRADGMVQEIKESEVLDLLLAVRRSLRGEWAGAG